VRNNHVQNPYWNNSQKNFHTFGRAELTTRTAKGCHPGSKGCKDELLISKAIYEDCNRTNKNLSIDQTDNQKAFDSIPHSWIEKSIELIGVNIQIVRFCKLLMEKRNTRLN